jgi:hypothetical protein
LQVIDGKSERGDHPVFRKNLKQWMLKITAYADRLLEDIDEVTSLTAMQILTRAEQHSWWTLALSGRRREMASVGQQEGKAEDGRGGRGRRRPGEDEN